MFVFACQGCAHPWNGKKAPLPVSQPQLIKSPEIPPTAKQTESKHQTDQVTVEMAPGVPVAKLPASTSRNYPSPMNPPIAASSDAPMPARSAHPSPQNTIRDHNSAKATGSNAGSGFGPPACRPALARASQPADSRNDSPSMSSQELSRMSLNVKRDAALNQSPDVPRLGSKPRQQFPESSTTRFPPASGPVRSLLSDRALAANSINRDRLPQINQSAPSSVTSANGPFGKPQFVTPANFEETTENDTPVRDPAQPRPQPRLQPQPQLQPQLEQQDRVEPELEAQPGPPAPRPDSPAPPGESGPVRIPLAGAESSKDIELTMKNGRVSLVTRNAPVQTVLNLLAEQQGLNLITSDEVTESVSVTLTNVAFEDALNSIVSVAGCTWTQNRGIVLVSKMGGTARSSPDLQGKVVQVFPLNFIAAADVELTIKGLLSPLGQVFSSQTMVGDKRRTQELVVVEDIPTSVARIAQYLQQIDQPPRQVMIEAHVLQVDLTDNTQHGVDWKFLTTYVGRNVGFNTVGFANAAASPASVFSFDGDHLDLVVEALKTTTDAKTLASPKVIVANGQEARIQIGAKLGYFVTTTTQTSTLQNVNFLNTGVLLRVTPQISNDGRVLMAVRPEISTGSISSAGLPQTNTTEAETTVLMDDNGGMIIGGLIKESDTDTQDKVPLLGDMWLVGRLFQRRAIARQRSEIIIVLIPRIAPYLPDGRAAELNDIQRATTPLFQNGLQQAPRPGDPRLPDAINNPRRLAPSRIPDAFANPQRTNPRPLNYFFPTEDEEFFPAENQFINLPVFNDQPQESLPQPVAQPISQLPIPPAIEVPRPAALTPAPPADFLPPVQTMP